MALFCSVLCFGQKKGFDPRAEHQNVLEHQAGKTVSAICVDYTDSSNSMYSSLLKSASERTLSLASTLNSESR